MNFAFFGWCHPGSNPELHKSAICKVIRGLSKNHEIADFYFSGPEHRGLSKNHEIADFYFSEPGTS